MQPFVFSYIRFSSPQQAKGASKERQLEAAARWANNDRQKLPLADEKFYDEGLSGWSGENVSTGRLGDFLQLVRTGKIARGSVLVVENLDRISRNPDIFASLEIIRSIVNAGIRIVTLSDGMEYTDDKLKENPALIFTIVGTFMRGQQESTMKSMRVRDALQRKRNRLDEKKWDTSYPAWLSLNKDKKGFTVIEAKANVIRRIFTDYDNGKSTHAISQELSAEGVERPYAKKTKHSKTLWHSSTIVDYLTSRSVIGEYQPKERKNGTTEERITVGNVKTNYYPAIISEDVFYRVQAKLINKKKVRGRRSEGLVNIFRGMLRCPYCGGSLMLNRQKLLRDGQQYGLTETYICDHSHHFDRSCLRYGWDREDLENCFMEFATDVHSEYAKFNKTDNTERQRQIDALQGKLTDIEKRLKRLLPLYEAEQIDLQQLQERSAELKTSRKSIADDLLTLQTIRTPEQTSFDLDKFINADMANTVNREQIADVVGRLFDHIDVYFVGLPSRYHMLQTARTRYLKQGRMKPNQIFNRLNRLLPFKKERFFVAYLKDGKRMSWPVELFKEPEFLDLWGRNAEDEFKALNLIP